MPTSESVKTSYRPPASHPWRKGTPAFHLKKARKIYNLRKNRERYHQDIDVSREYRRNKHRVKAGIPIDLPVMKSWDFKKGRVK